MITIFSRNQLQNLDTVTENVGLHPSAIQLKDCAGLDLNPHYGLIDISGIDAQTFLQGLVTIDMTKLLPNHASLAAFCNQKGRIRSLFTIIALEQNHYLLHLPRNLLSKTLQDFALYGKFSKVTIKENTHWQQLGIMYETPAEIKTDKKIKTSEATLFTSLAALSKTPFFILPMLASNRFILFYDSTSGDTAASTTITDITASSTSAATLPMLHPTLQFSDLHFTLQFSDWQLANIRAGIPEITLETTDMFLPAHLNLEQLNALHFNKGCYLGQEIIARMHYRGNIKRTMQKITLAKNNLNNLTPGMTLTNANQEELGKIISLALNSNEEYEMLLETRDPSLSTN